MKLKVLVYIICVILLFVCDFCAYVLLQFHYVKGGYKLRDYIAEYANFHNLSLEFPDSYSNYIMLDDNYSENNVVKWEIYRPIENKNSLNSILIFGCSAAYGWTLSNNETFSYDLGQILKDYRIYNRARCAWTTNHMLYQLENKDFSNIPHLRYIIYVFINNHIIRNYNSYHMIGTPYYKINRNGELSLCRYSIKHVRLPIYNLIKAYKLSGLYKDLLNGKQSDKVILTKKILKASKENVERIYGDNVKFIILRYDNGDAEPYDYMFKELEARGFVVVSVNDLSNNNFLADSYQVSHDDRHPNARAWKEITPLFVKYLQDRGYFKD